MKRFHFLQTALIAVLMVVAASCTSIREASEGDYENAPARRQVFADPYYGNRNVIVLERDPFTGQYYQVSPFGSFSDSYYGFGYGYPYNSRYYNRGGGYYRSAPSRAPQQSPQQREANRNAARETILGKKGQ